jgi:hypothetical protein
LHRRAIHGHFSVRPAVYGGSAVEIVMPSSLVYEASRLASARQPWLKPPQESLVNEAASN